MSFSFTPEEQARVQAAAALGYSLDPIGKYDLAMLCVFSIIYAVDFFAVLYLLWNWNYPPIKSKGPGFLAGAYIAIAFWFIGEIQVSGHIHLKGTAYANCKAFGVWLRIILGICMFSALVALRSYSLFCIFELNKPYRGLSRYLPFIIYTTLMLIYGIVVQVLPEDKTIVYKGLLDVCVYKGGFKASLFIFAWAAWVYVAIVNWQIRKIKSSFNESREMLFCCVLVFAVLTFGTIVNYVRGDYLFDLPLRLASTWLNHIASNLVWWTLAGVPLFNCMFRRERYLRYWMKKLSDDGLQRQYEQQANVATDIGMLCQHATLGNRSFKSSISNTGLSNQPESDFNSSRYTCNTLQARSLNLAAPAPLVSTQAFYQPSHHMDAPSGEKTMRMDSIRDANTVLNRQVEQQHACITQDRLYGSADHMPEASTPSGHSPLAVSRSYHEQVFYMDSRWADAGDGESLSDQYSSRRLI